ncbi:MAG TPA: hypothetical protein VGB85_19730 [Nannocystis sp.]
MTPGPASPELVQGAVDPDRYVVTPGGEPERLRHNFFYRDGTPAHARAMLEAFVRDEFPALMAGADSGDAERVELAAERILQRVVFFTAAARGRPEVLRAYEDVARALPGEQVGIVIKLLAHAGDAETERFLRSSAELSKGQPAAALIAETLRGGVGPAPEIEAATRAPITGGGQLDVRWIQFMATGDTVHLGDILAVLAWPDRVRDHLQALLAASPVDAQAATLRALAPLGFRFDPRTHAPQNLDDLDLRAIMSDGRLDGPRFKSFVDALPAPLPPEVAVAAATKASAMWSLASNAAEHPPVLAACEAALAKQTGAARLSLLEILAIAHERRGDLAAAERAWSSYRELDPRRPGVAEHLEELATKR